MFFKYITVAEHEPRILEGQIRAKELAEYLTKMNCSNNVWLSEDATVIKSNVTYDPKTNQLVGLVLPTDETTGCPMAYKYMATNAECIKQHLMHVKSSVVYVVMAQPIDEKIPPFVLQIFGSDNRFETTKVLKRWNHTKIQLEK